MKRRKKLEKLERVIVAKGAPKVYKIRSLVDYIEYQDEFDKEPGDIYIDCSYEMSKFFDELLKDKELKENCDENESNRETKNEQK